MTADQAPDLSAWIGRKEVRADQVTAAPIAALRATLDMSMDVPAAGEALPPLWHWLYFLPLYRQSEAGPDGHAKRGGFLPPVSLPRRMWAGGRLRFHGPLRVGDQIRRESTIVDVSAKCGRTGQLAFVLVRHEVFGPNGLALTEEHDIVYRENPKANAPPPSPAPAPAHPQWHQTITPTELLLFRYSALTFNGHRIHYDRKYVTEVEGYPGLVVHGPLIATLLAGMVSKHRPGAAMTEFAFRAHSPIFDIASFQICGRAHGEHPNKLTLWAETPDGQLAMQAAATLSHE